MYIYIQCLPLLQTLHILTLRVNSFIFIYHLSKLNYSAAYNIMNISPSSIWDRRGCDIMGVGFITTFAIEAYLD